MTITHKGRAYAFHGLVDGIRLTMAAQLAQADGCASLPLSSGEVLPDLGLGDIEDIIRQVITPPGVGG